MFIVVYRYKPSRSVDKDRLRELSSRVAKMYESAGCLRSSLMCPNDDSQDWLDVAWYISEEHWKTVEGGLDAAGLLDDLFVEFCKLTGLSPSAISRATYEVLMDTRAQE